MDAQSHPLRAVLATSLGQSHPLRGLTAGIGHDLSGIQFCLLFENHREQEQAVAYERARVSPNVREMQVTIDPARTRRIRRHLLTDDHGGYVRDPVRTVLRIEALVVLVALVTLYWRAHASWLVFVVR